MLFVQVHYQVGNETDGFFFWCIPNWEERGWWQAFQVPQKIIFFLLFLLVLEILLLFQLYMLIIVVVGPTIVMTFAYTAISKEVTQSDF